MNVSRRDVVVAGALALGASGLLLDGASTAEAGDDESVAPDEARQAVRIRTGVVTR